MPRYSMAEDTFPGSFDSAPQIFSSDTTFRRSAQDDKMEVHSLKQAVTSQMQKGPSSTHLLINSVVLRCRSGFRLRAPAALTPAKWLNLPNSLAGVRFWTCASHKRTPALMQRIVAHGLGLIFQLLSFILMLA